jgi:7-carboxy-7-deazaguanine synthase
VRLTACDLRCVWCDSPYAFHEGRKMSVDEVVAAVEHYGCPLVEMTGGEPLLQKALYPLMERLHVGGHQVLIETGGHRSIEHVPAWATVIMDVKCPGSGEAAKHDTANFARLRPHDEVKFVVADRTDYEYAREVLRREHLVTRVAAVHLSPVHGGLDAKTLSEWVLEDRLPVRVQLQVHKYIWGADVRGV